MIWGKLDEISDEYHNLYQVMFWAFPPHAAPCFSSFLYSILGPEGGIGGDPGWLIEEVDSELTERTYAVWTDLDELCSDPEEVNYTEKEVRAAACDVLRALADAFPEQATHAWSVIERFQLTGSVPSRFWRPTARLVH